MTKFKPKKKKKKSVIFELSIIYGIYKQIPLMLIIANDANCLIPLTIKIFPNKTCTISGDEILYQRQTCARQ